jgi:3,4-dihydroxy 2-butanone 4-phosphate synthase/GTP cyclohydrolase II
VLRELGVHRMRLLTNQPRRVVAADGYGLEIVEQVLLRPARPSELPPPGDS